jgi:hypothetical protein
VCAAGLGESCDVRSGSWEVRDGDDADDSGSLVVGSQVSWKMIDQAKVREERAVHSLLGVQRTLGR